MRDGIKLLLAGVAAAVVLTAAFAPGKQTIGGITALGSASQKVIGQAEGV